MQCGSCKDKFTARAFAPAHITGFFQIHDHKEPMKKGSTGCGVVLDRGVHTTVTIGDDIESTDIYLNGEKVAGDTSRAVVSSMTEIPVTVESTSEIPIGCGFGASGAGALGTAYALDHALSLGHTASQLNDIAHVAEVSNGSGLGDVTGQAHGGILIRKTPGAPSVASVDQIPSKENDVYCVVLGELSTSSVLSDQEMVNDINNAGKEAMKKLMQKPSVENFMHCSRDFTIQSMLASEKVMDAIEAADTIGVTASQAMLGNAVFSMPSQKDSNELENIFSEFGTVLRFKVRTGTIRIN
ncbi:pantoate kinase [Methanolobus profundi]|uniref:Pantoate kinase n=1 Tax=Methanolobus profundi TaxID=487685 RepID=A0A1I4UTX7_9EURY|nr:pantoate kinase [Methanolobus profundi]SFM92422.1 pantothenate kinase [Methanolobus profundi]